MNDVYRQAARTRAAIRGFIKYLKKYEKGMFMNRRNFIRTAGLGAVAYTALPNIEWAWGDIPSRTGQIIEGRKLNIACIGCGGKGRSDVAAMAGESIVALCDVDFERGKSMFDKHPQAKRYKDFRRMLMEMDDQVDAVTVSTPDHMHFPAAMMAIKMGKHVFVQKPLSHTIEEARILTAALEGSSGAEPKGRSW